MSNWRTDTGNWSNAGKWDAGIPDATHDAKFDASSFAIPSQVVTVNATAYCKDLDFTGATNSPTLAINNAFFVSGNITTIAAMAVSGTNYLLPNGASDRTWTTNGCVWTVAYIGCESGFTGIVRFADDITFKVWNTRFGEWVTNGHTVNCTTWFSNNAIADVTFTLSSSTVNCTSVDFSLGAVTLTANTATINCSGNFAGGGIATYNIVNLTGATSTVSGNNTFNQFNLTSGTTQSIAGVGSTQTASKFGLSGSAGHIHTLSNINFIQKYGNKVSCDYMHISNSTVTPVGKFYAGTHSTDGGGNSGWIFTDPPSPRICYRN